MFFLEKSNGVPIASFSSTFLVSFIGGFFIEESIDRSNVFICSDFQQ
jgi:hypothetical protein